MLPGHLFSLTTILSSVFFGVLFWLIYSIVLKPLSLIKFYGKQGAAEEYYPIIGGYGKRIIESAQTGDFMATYKKILQEENPNVRAFASNLGSKGTLALVEPGLIKEFLLKQDGNYVKAESYMDLYKCLVGTGLVTSEGETWKKHRKIVSNVFHFDFIKEAVPSIIETTREFFDKLKTKDLNNVDIMKEFEKIAGEIVGKVFFGQQFSKYSLHGQPFIEYIYKVGMPLVEESLGIYNNLFGAWFVKAGFLRKHREIMNGIKEIREFVRKVVEERKGQLSEKSHQSDRKNLLDLLLQTQENSNEDSLTIEGIIDEFLTFFIAGTDTTSHLLTLAVYNLTQKENAYEKAFKESVFRTKSESEITYIDIEKMPFTLGVLKETLRLTNPALNLFFRRALKDHQLKDFNVKKGTLVFYFTGHNCFKEEYFENPNAFEPERWLSENDAKWRKEPYSYTPFSAGPRNCIGQNLALLESRIVLAMFLKEFDVKVPENYKMRMTARFLLEPYDPLLLNLEMRK